MTKLNDTPAEYEDYLVYKYEQIACGWPSKSAGRSSKRRIGECWPRSSSKNKVNEVIISMVIENPVEVLDILIHEDIHVIDDCQNGHKAAFKKIALAIGLTGKMTATTAGPDLKLQLEAIASNLGAYPHGSIDFSTRTKQTTRMIKVTCIDDECGMIFRTSNKWAVIADNNMSCPVCGGPAHQG